MGKKSKRYIEISAKVDRSKFYSGDEGLKLVKELAKAKFDETIEAAAHLMIKKSHTIRDTLVLPHQFSSDKKILVFAQGDKAKEAEEAGATYVGGADFVEKIKGGWLDFDVCIATPDMMKDVGKLGPVLGRRGLMPNPKTRTVTMDVSGAIAELRKGRVEFRADKVGVVHLAVGKASMDVDSLLENLKVFVSELHRKRPSDLKGDYFKTLSISSTMGPGVRVDLTSLGV